MERPLGELPLCAALIDGTLFKDPQMIAALARGHRRDSSRVKASHLINMVKLQQSV
jgi:hypothetical protein